MRGVPAPDPASSATVSAATSAQLGTVPHRADLDVLIPTRDRASALAVTLTGLLSQDLSARLVLADQTPGTSSAEQPEIASLIAVMRRHGWEVEVDHRDGVGRGVTEQRQHLLDRAERTYVLMLDDDVLLERWVLRQLIEAMDVLGCGFVGMAHAAASYLDDVRPHELETFELWPGGKVEPERIRKGDPAWERWRLHNAANVQHLLDRLPSGALDARGWVAYKVAWVAGCVLFRADALRGVGGFSFWADLPPNLRGEDVVTHSRSPSGPGARGCCRRVPGTSSCRPRSRTVRSTRTRRCSRTEGASTGLQVRVHQSEGWLSVGDGPEVPQIICHDRQRRRLGERAGRGPEVVDATYVQMSVQLGVQRRPGFYDDSVVGQHDEAAQAAAKYPEPALSVSCLVSAGKELAERRKADGKDMPAEQHLELRVTLASVLDEAEDIGVHHERPGRNVPGLHASARAAA